MREILSKQEFTNKCNKRIENRVKLSEFRKTTFVDVLNKFDGKVYNKRFRDALCTAFASDMVFVSESGNSLVLNLRNDKYNYNDYESIYFNLVLDNGRISAKKTIEENYTCIWLKNFEKETESIKDSINNYDKYLSMAKEIDDIIEKFSDIPYSARQNFTNFKTWYLK